MLLLKLLWRKTLTLFFCTVVLVVSVTACGQSAPITPSDAVNRDVTVALPTAAPTFVSTPVNTRVMPVEILTPPPTTTITPIPDEGRALVVGVVDGHTVLVVMEGDSPNQVYAVKYLGIEAPPPDDPWGTVTRETNRKLTNLKVVRLVRDVTDFDDEGLLHRYVYLDDQLLSVVLAEQGLAQAAVNPPDTRFENEILQAEARAKKDKLGLWSGASPTPTLPPVVETEESTVEAEITPLTTVTVTLTVVTPEITPSGTVTVTATASATNESLITSTVTVTPTVTVERSNSQ